MSNLIKHAKKELEIAGLFNSDEYDKAVATSVMELIELFSKQGHSGFSASITRNLFSKLADFDVISPLTGEDNEWNDIGNNTFQNNRNSAVFKTSKDGIAHFIYAIIWHDIKGNSFTDNVEGISSSQNIPAFPFNPKKFIIDVKKNNKDEYEIVDKNKLEEVWKVYSRP